MNDVNKFNLIGASIICIAMALNYFIISSKYLFTLWGVEIIGAIGIILCVTEFRLEEKTNAFN